ncbi:MAG: hypothetical protein HQK98_07050 [Nitrospirae bacterium]|nr:hypothetical protein [Nitrospirota bacterium]
MNDILRENRDSLLFRMGRLFGRVKWIVIFISLRYNRVMSVIAIPRALRDKLGDEASEAFVEIFNKVDNESRKELATKSDLENVKLELRAEIEKSKSETLKRMFIFWAGQLIAIFAMLKMFLK